VNTTSIKADLLGLTLFSGVQDRPLMRAFAALLEAASPEAAGGSAEAAFRSEAAIVRAWASFMEAFVSCGRPFEAVARPAGRPFSWFAALASLALGDENAWTLAVERGEQLPPLLRALADADISRLSRIAGFDVVGFGFELAAKVREAGNLTAREPSELEDAARCIEDEARALWQEEGRASAFMLDVFPKPKADSQAKPGSPKPASQNAVWPADALAAHIRAKGAGVLGQAAAFRWESGQSPDGQAAAFRRGSRSSRDGEAEGARGRLVPVRNPDPVRLKDLFGYEDQREAVISNTERFLRGKAANNVLLYGDRGTGKSATIKAICNDYADRGLRLVEARKDRLADLPAIMETLSTRGLRFIIFIDDLSFETTGDSFNNLKGLLEGGIESLPRNIVVYATSNRRHMVTERFSDRPSPDAGPRSFDTMQEQLSLSDRFGLTVVYTAPDQDEFLAIAERLAAQRGIAADTPNFRENAIRWERWFNGRSPRTAVQYVDWVSAGDGFPWDQPLSTEKIVAAFC
jgi:predicted AAA+ superfamily ATPase